MDSRVQKVNHNLIVGWMIIVAVVFVAYLGEVIKGERTLGYMIIFMLFTAVPAFYCYYRYRKNPFAHSLRYYIVAGYFLMYIFSMMTGSTNMVFCYILPMLSLLILYHQPGLIVFTGVVSIVINIISIATNEIYSNIQLSNYKDIEIQFGMLVLCFVGSYLVAKLYNNITMENQEYVKMLDEKSRQIQKMTFQTIATIANTIDAKDRYTRGHSKRVSEYSAALAAELGMSQEEIQNVHSIALLHDIGKIGVPDAVLNKPGKLTEEEYKLMKQHTEVGGEILKDIGMIPGIDIGAKYHHERYDGKGYPTGLVGEDIPYIARIISIADAYDAMTSTRVYRKRLSDEEVLVEMKAGIGRQFDPDMAKAFIRLLEEGRFHNMSPDSVEEDMDAASELLSRVMERNTQQNTMEIQLDYLTAVYNRSYGEQLVRKALVEHKGCFMLFDLDNLRLINDTYGFMRGDMLLKVVSKYIIDLDTDIIISRYGGDEFSAFFCNIKTEEQALRCAARFMEELNHLKATEQEVADLSISIGMSLCEKTGEDYATILQNTDKALYYVKQQGGGTYYLHPTEPKGKSQNSSKVDLNNLIQFIRQNNHYQGAFQLRYPEFAKIYDFVKKVADRNNQQIQILMFTVVPVNEEMSVEDRDKVMEYLEQAIISSVRGVDITTRYSSTQRIVLFMNLSEEQISIVTDRIMQEFYRMYDKKDVKVYYDVADLSQ